MVTWPGRFTVMAYPTRGKFQFIPDKQCNEIDAVLAFLTFLCGTEPMPQRWQAEWGAMTPPLTRLALTRQQGAFVLQQMSLAFVEIERAILSDPYNSLPLHEWVSQTHPATKHLPEETTVMSVNATSKTGNKKMLCLAGSPGSTAFMHAVNFQSAEFQEWARNEIDLVRDVADQVDKARLEQRDGSAQVTLIVEDNSKKINQFGRMVKTTNKDHANLDKRLQVIQAVDQERLAVNRDQLEEQRNTTESVRAAELGIREEVRFNGQETTEQLRSLGGVIVQLGEKVDQLDLQQSIRFQGMMDQERRNLRETQAARADLQQAKQEILTTMGDFFGRLAAYLAERDVQVDQRIDSIAGSVQQLQISFLEHRDQLEHLHEHNHKMKRKVRRCMEDVYASILTVMDVAPQMIAARVGSLINKSTQKTWYYLKQLRAWGVVDREQQDAEVAQPQKATQPQSTNTVGEDPESPKPSILKRVTRRLWHYFLRRAPPAAGDTHPITPTEKTKNGDEKT